MVSPTWSGASTSKKTLSSPEPLVPPATRPAGAPLSAGLYTGISLPGPDFFSWEAG